MTQGTNLHWEVNVHNQFAAETTNDWSWTLNLVNDLNGEEFTIATVEGGPNDTLTPAAPPPPPNIILTGNGGQKSWVSASTKFDYGADLTVTGSFVGPPINITCSIGPDSGAKCCITGALPSGITTNPPRDPSGCIKNGIVVTGGRYAFLELHFTPAT